MYSWCAHVTQMKEYANKQTHEWESLCPKSTPLTCSICVQPWGQERERERERERDTDPKAAVPNNKWRQHRPRPRQSLTTTTTRRWETFRLPPGAQCIARVRSLNWLRALMRSIWNVLISKPYQWTEVKWPPISLCCQVLVGQPTCRSEGLETLAALGSACLPF